MLRRYPHQCSGGQLQRIAIAMAIACDPELIVCDEPTTGLDVTTQAEVVEMLMRLIRSRRMAAIYISHDLALLGAIADELAIFYAGEIVEIGPTAEVLRRPAPPLHAGAPRRPAVGPPRDDARSGSQDCRRDGSLPNVPLCTSLPLGHSPCCRNAHPALLPVDDRRDSSLPSRDEVRGELAPHAAGGAASRRPQAARPADAHCSRSTG